MQTINTPILPGKFLHLKYLHISLIGYEAISPAYDYLSLVSFLVASPSLETFIFQVSNCRRISFTGHLGFLVSGGTTDAVILAVYVGTSA
jgi:hypothetical protein